MKDENSSFARIYEAVRKIPTGKVMSYGQVAVMAGYRPGAARVVGWALKAIPPDSTVPWQRVVNKAGVLSIINPRVDALEQCRRLQAEGVVVEEKEGRLVIEKRYFASF